VERYLDRLQILVSFVEIELTISKEWERAKSIASFHRPELFRTILLGPWNEILV
jgi:hypothetical protein